MERFASLKSLYNARDLWGLKQYVYLYRDEDFFDLDICSLLNISKSDNELPYDIIEYWLVEVLDIVNGYDEIFEIGDYLRRLVKRGHYEFVNKITDIILAKDVKSSTLAQDFIENLLIHFYEKYKIQYFCLIEKLSTLYNPVEYKYLDTKSKEALSRYFDWLKTKHIKSVLPDVMTIIVEFI
jgi:hypothetical protein